MSTQKYWKCHFGCETDGVLHRFPSPRYNKDRFNLWLKVLDINMQNRDPFYIYNNLRLCDNHFELCYRTPSKILTRNAIPTINIASLEMNQEVLRDLLPASQPDVIMNMDVPSTSKSLTQLPGKQMSFKNEVGCKKLSLNIGFIGGGNMSTAIIMGILKYGKYPPSNIWVSGPHLENLQTHKQLGANITSKNGEVLHNCDVVFLGVKPGVLSHAIQGCLDTLPGNVLSKNVLFVSMLAGIDLENLRQAVSKLPGQVSVVRIMPNTPMAVGAGICLYSPESTVTDQQCTLLETILQPCGACTRIPEPLMGPLGALTGCGPAFMYVVIEALADGAVKQGVPRAIAIKLAAQVLMGSGQMVSETGRHPAVLKDEVCSPGGSTICGVTALEDGKIRATLIHAIEAAAIRTKEMGKK